MKLSPEQTAKIARLWVPVAGQLYVDPDGHPDEWWRVLRVVDGKIAELVDDGGYLSDDMTNFDLLVPCYWGDHATADGLPRTVRAALHDESLVCANDRSGWWVRYLAKTHPYAPVVIAYGETESEAWIAAILAAPEPK
jgi:hypothetical protein